MDIAAVFVIGLTVLGAALIGTWAVTQGTKPHLPNGMSYDIGVYKCVLRVESTARTVAPYELDGISRAIEETAKEWARQASRIGVPARTDADKALNGMVVLLMGDAAFDEMRNNARLSIGVVAFQSRVTQTFGTGPYMLVIKRSADGLSRLVVHETCHALCDYAKLSLDQNNNHRDPVVWGPGGVEETVSARV